jgi:hypothetical protein
MAASYSYSGSFNLKIEGRAAGSGDVGGSLTIPSGASFSFTFDPAGGDAPTMSGWLYGTLTVANGDILIAHATDPFQGMGDALYAAGFLPSGAAKLKILHIRNTGASGVFNVARAAANGAPVFKAASDGSADLDPGDHWQFYKKAGTATITSGSNDALTFAVVSGSPTAEFLAIYGP